MNDNSIKQQPIFLVGVPRSGTTLLAAMLCAHSRLSCGPENHFFAGLTDEMETNICLNKYWPENAVNYLFAIKHGEFPIPVDYGISRNKIVDYLSNSDKTVKSVASVLPELFMRKLEKIRWIDKTPNYQMHVRKIRKHFPLAPIISIVRDPRDVALSLNKVSWGPKTFLEGLIEWHSYQNTSKDFFETDNLSYSVRYEDLLSSPEEELSKICTFIGEPFEKGMLNTAQSAQHVNRINEPYKKKVAENVDKSRAHTWKNILTEEEKRQANAIVGNYLEKKEEISKTLQYIHIVGLDRPLNPWDLDLIRKVIQESNVRFWHISADEKPVKSLLVGRRLSRIERKILYSIITPILTTVGLKKFAKNLWSFYWYSYMVRYRSDYRKKL